MVSLIKKIKRHLYWQLEKIKGNLKTLKVRFSKPVYGINDKEDRKVKVIVSLTSYKKRFNILKICLKTIFTQTVKADKIILYVSEKDHVFVPKSIFKLQKYGLTIRFVKEDLRPHKKYYYAMREYPDSIIITIDDDSLYDRHLIEELLNTYTKNKNSIVASRARIIKFNSTKFEAYNNWPLNEKAYSPSMNLLATGVGGVLYPPHLLNPNMLFDLKQIYKYVNVDDLWLKAMEIKSNVPTVMCNTEVDKRRTEIIAARKTGLARENVVRNDNDRCWNQLNEEYNLLSKLKE